MQRKKRRKTILNLKGKKPQDINKTERLAWLRLSHTDKFSHISYHNPAAEQEINLATPRKDIHKIILSHLSFTPIHVDELIRACHVSVSKFQSIFLELELAGRVKRLAGERAIMIEDIE